MTRVIGVIPARFGSTRMLGKPLVEILGKPMIWWVVSQAQKAKILDEVIVATDDQRIEKAVLDFGGEVILTSKKLATGTDRVAEVAKKIQGDVFINIQGDQPLLDPKTIDQIAKPLVEDKEVMMTSAMIKIASKKAFDDPNTVKVVVDKNNFALYFSRSPIPHPGKKFDGFFKHIGIYGFKRDFLLEFKNLRQTLAEKKESLEQLRVLENGYKIKMVEVFRESPEVNVPEDLKEIIKHARATKS